MNRKRLLAFALALSALAACVAILLFTGSGSTQSTRRLADGSVLTLGKITKGTKHRYVSGNLLQRTVDRVLPERWAKKLGAQVVTHNSSNVTHLLWLERVAPSNSGPGIRFMTSLWPRVTNEAGFDRSYQAAAQLFVSGRYIQGFLMDGCPTDTRNLVITIRQISFARLPTVYFNVSNPDFVSRRQWLARPCPIETVQDDVSLRLEQFTTQAHNPTTVRGTELAFVIQDRAVPTNNWFARSLRIFNEAGSEFSPSIHPADAARARTNATFPGSLSAAEPYKLRFELRRTSYGPDDMKVFTAVSVPGTNGPQATSLRATLHGFTLVADLSAYGSILARIEPPQSDWRLDLPSVVDDHGRWRQVRRFDAGNDGIFSGGISLDPDSTTVDLTFALARLRTLEIIAQPTLGE